MVNLAEDVDYLTGRVLGALDRHGLAQRTLVFWTSDNGPWLQEQRSAGNAGPFSGAWLGANVSPRICTVCPSGLTPAAAGGGCVKRGGAGAGAGVGAKAGVAVAGLPCGADVGLGSSWEANLRMPAIVRWPEGGVRAGASSSELVSTADVFVTALALAGAAPPPPSTIIDGKNMLPVLRGGRSAHRFLYHCEHLSPAVLLMIVISDACC